MDYLDPERLDADFLPGRARELFSLLEEEIGTGQARKVMTRVIERFGGDHIRITSPEAIRRRQDEQLVTERLADNQPPAVARRGTIFSLRQVNRMKKQMEKSG